MNSEFKSPYTWPLIKQAESSVEFMERSLSVPVLQPFRNNPEITGALVGGGLGYLYDIIRPEYHKSNKKQKKKKNEALKYKRILIGSLLGMGSGKFFRDVVDPRSLTDQEYEAFSVPKNLSADDWQALYKGDKPGMGELMYNLTTKQKPLLLKSQFGFLDRYTTPKSKITRDDLIDLGFQKSLVAVPESGQKTWTTYRHPQHNVHFHDHGEKWVYHIDSHPSMQMLMQRVRNYPDISYYKNMIRAKLYGVPHALYEGAPGFVNYAVNRFKGGETMNDLIKRYESKQQIAN